MPTPMTLEEQGLLEKIDVELEPDEQPLRLIFAYPRVILWLEEELEGLETDGYVEGALRPEEQFDAMLHQFISGAQSFQMVPKWMSPQSTGIWELRTHDLRIFAWFWRRNVCILSGIDTAFRCKEHDLYAGYRNQAVRDREALDLDPPKFIPGELEDVL